MDEKSNLYIVAIVGVIAVVALVVLVIGVSSRGTIVRGSGLTASADQTGRMYDVVETDSDYTPDVEGGSCNYYYRYDFSSTDMDESTCLGYGKGYNWEENRVGGRIVGHCYYTQVIPCSRVQDTPDTPEYVS
jgi:hypothetical protein